MMKAVYKNEWRKLRLQKKYIVLLVIGLALGLLWAILGKLISSALNQLSGAVIQFPMGMSLTGSLPFFSYFYLPLMVCMAVSDLFISEYSHQTIKTSLMRPVTRLKLYSAKLLAILTYFAGFLACLFVVTAATAVIMGYVTSPWLILQALLGYAMTLIPLAVLLCFAALLAQVIRSGSLFMFLMIFSMILSLVLPLLIPVLQGTLFYGYMGWFKLFSGSLAGWGAVPMPLLILLGTGGACYFGGTLLMDKRDF